MGMQESPGEMPAASRPRARRLTFSYQDDQVQLIDDRPVDMVPPPADDIPDLEERSGFVVEVRDAEERPVWRRAMHNPIQEDVEVFNPPDEEQHFSRQVVERPSGTFSIVVPQLDQDGVVTLHHSSGRLRAEDTRLREIARFPLPAEGDRPTRGQPDR